MDALNIVDVEIRGGRVLKRMTQRLASQDWASEAPTGVRFQWPLGEAPAAMTEITHGSPSTADWVEVVGRAGKALVRLRLRLGKKGQPVVVRVELADDSGVTTARAVRALRLGELQRAVDQMLAEPAVARMFGPGWHQPLERPGRAGRPDRFYAEWAARYVEACARDRRQAIKTMIDEATAAGEWLTAPMVRAYLNRARSRGLLTKAEAGMAGGRLTAKAKQLLDLERGE